jgi:hypothetical protein
VRKGVGKRRRKWEEIRGEEWSSGSGKMARWQDDGTGRRVGREEENGRR